MAIDVTHADDLRAVYLQVFDAFSLHSPSEVVQAHKTINSRYARELLGALVQGKMLWTEEDNDGEIYWQVSNPGTYDEHTREEAEAAIDLWLGKTTPKSTTKKGSTVSTKKKEASPCLCGCGEPAMSNYRPGHDARHAGQIGREIAANFNTKGFDRRTLLAVLPSDALKAKAEKVAETATKPKADKPKTPVEGTIKVGKNEVIARRHPNGLVEYLPADGKSDWKTASASASKTFAEG